MDTCLWNNSISLLVTEEVTSLLQSVSENMMCHHRLGRFVISDSFDNLGDKGHRWCDIYIHPRRLHYPEDE